MTIELTTPSTVWRALTMADLDALVTIFSDWRHDDKPHNRGGIEKQLEKWVFDMEVEPSDHPILPDSTYREALICFEGADPLAIIVFLVRGANDPKNWPLALSILTMEIFAIAPQFRRQSGRMNSLLSELLHSSFNNTRPDVVIGLSADPAIDAWLVRSALEDRREDTKRRGQVRQSFVMSRQNYLDRMAQFPADDIPTTLRKIPL